MKVIDALKAKGLEIPAPLATKWEKVNVAEGAITDFMIGELKSAQPKMFEEDDTLEATLAKNEKLLLSLFKMFMASKGVEPAAAPEAKPATESAAVPQAFQEAIERMNGFALEGMLAASGLDDNGKAIVRKTVDLRSFAAEKVQESIRDAKDMITKITEGARPAHLQVVRDGGDKLQEAWNDMFLYEVRDITVRQRIREATTGASISERPGGRVNSMRSLVEMSCGHAVDWLSIESVKEALDTVVTAGLLTNGANLAITYQWDLPSEYDSWRNLCQVKPTGSLQTQYAMATGSLAGWTDLNSSTGYASMTNAGAKKESYTPTGKGGLLYITLADFVNDNIGAFQAIPTMVTAAGKEALSYFFWYTLIQTNPTMATDSVAFFAAARGNLINEPLAETGLTTAIRAMITMLTPGTTARQLAGVPKWLVTSLDPTQQKAAYGLIMPSFGQPNQTATWLQAQGLQHLVNPHTTDFTDWFMFRSAKGSIAEIGFYGGQEVPRVEIANDPLVGYRFTHDQIAIKGSHYWSGSLIAPESGLWSSVAG